MNCLCSGRQGWHLGKNICGIEAIGSQLADADGVISLGETIAASSPEGAVDDGVQTGGSTPTESTGAEDVPLRSSTEGGEKPPS